MAEKVFSLSASTTGVSRLPEVRQSGRSALPLREFIAGPENQLLTQIRASVTSDWGRFNPLFIHGVSGIGKTHLLHCLRQESRRIYPELKDAFVTGADYARAIAEAIDVDCLDELRAKHRTVDLFILDGLHQLETKKVAQHELLRLLDFATEKNLQVIVTSLLPLDQLAGLQAELRSRLSGGLVFPLAPPQRETRIAILRRLALSSEIALSDEDLQQLAAGAQHVVTTVTDLQATIQRRSCQSMELSEATRRPELTGRLLLKAVAKQFRVSVRDMTGASRRQAVVRARAACVQLARTLLDMSYQQIGKLLGNRDHTTMMNALRRSDQFMRDDPCFKRTVQDVTDSLTA